VVVIARCKPSIKVNELRTIGIKLSKMPPRGTVVQPKVGSVYEFAALYWFTGD
jgi:hypothetical protein